MTHGEILTMLYTPCSIDALGYGPAQGQACTDNSSTYVHVDYLKNKRPLTHGFQDLWIKDSESLRRTERHSNAERCVFDV